MLHIAKFKHPCRIFSPQSLSRIKRDGPYLLKWKDRLEDFKDPQGGTEELADLMELKILFLRPTTWLSKREIIKMQNLKHRLLAE